MPVISSPTRSRYSSYIMSRSASRIRWRITCLAVCAAMRPKSSGVTSRSSIWSLYCWNLTGSISGSSGSRISPVSGSMVVCSSIVSTIRCASRRSGMMSSVTRKSAVSGSMSTRAYFAAPGCFLYALNSASSRATRSLSGEMFFSRASAPIASRISRDMRLLLDEVGAGDVAVGDGDDPGGGGDRDLGLRRADELARERAMTVARVARAHARTASEVPAEVVGLGQRPRAAGTGDLERVVLAHLRKHVRDTLAEVEANAVGMVDEQANDLARHLSQQHLDVGGALGEALLDVSLDLVHLVSFGPTKKRATPASDTTTGRCRPVWKLCLQNSTAPTLEGCRTMSFKRSFSGPAGARWRPV